MNVFWKTILFALISAVLSLQIRGQEGVFSILLTLAATTLICVGIIELFHPVQQFLKQLEAIGNVRSDFLSILLRALGIGLTAEISSVVCSDAGNASLAKMIQLLANAAILAVSIPVFSALLDILKKLIAEF